MIRFKKEGENEEPVKEMAVDFDFGPWLGGGIDIGQIQTRGKSFCSTI